MTSADDDYMLVVSPQCAMTLQHVEVKYSGDADDGVGYEDLETVWKAEAVDEGRKSVKLLQENDGYTDEFEVGDVDTGRPVIIGWTGVWADGDTGGGSLGGILDDVDDDKILWFDGVKSRGTYDAEALLLPWRGTPC